MARRCWMKSTFGRINRASRAPTNFCPPGHRGPPAPVRPYTAKPTRAPFSTRLPPRRPMFPLRADAPKRRTDTGVVLLKAGRGVASGDWRTVLSEEYHQPSCVSTDHQDGTVCSAPCLPRTARSRRVVVSGFAIADWGQPRSRFCQRQPTAQRRSVVEVGGREWLRLIPMIPITRWVASRC